MPVQVDVDGAIIPQDLLQLLLVVLGDFERSPTRFLPLGIIALRRGDAERGVALRPRQVKMPKDGRLVDGQALGLEVRDRTSDHGLLWRVAVLISGRHTERRVARFGGGLILVYKWVERMTGTVVFGCFCLL